MNSRNILLLILTLALISCSNLNNKNLESGQEISKTILIDSIKKNESVTFNTPSNLDLKFETFIKHFSKDSIFQVSRIDFPLKVRESDPDKDYDLSERIIQKTEFKIMDFTYDKSKSNKQFDRYEQNIKVLENKAVIEIRGIDNGILADYYFEKKNGIWKLLTWVDSST